MIELKYQATAIKKLKNAAFEFLEDKGEFVIVFQAPTGAGKTYMLAKTLQDLIKEKKPDKPVSFVWISVNSLHEQSKESLEKYFSIEKSLHCISINEIDSNQIHENEILFLNWDKLNKEKNLFIRDNERDWNLSKVVANTKEEGREIILVIDESHRSASTSKSQELISEISPKLTFEVSATPKEVSSDIRIRVPLEDVIEEEMIKSEILINPGLVNIENNEDIIASALSKRKELRKYFMEEGSSINPLLLVQIPDKKQGSVRNPEDKVIQILSEKGITLENGKLAIWLSDKDSKLNLDTITKNDDTVEVLIFKQAIALGWDCPRASILLLQREWNAENYTFNIQTLGRIMRMPEHKHYNKRPELNAGYVFTASDNFTIVEELATNYISLVQMIRDESSYLDIDLPSQFIRRKREKTRLSGKFKDCLLSSADEMEIKKQLNVNFYTHTKSIGTEGSVSDIDKSQKVEFQKSLNIAKDREELMVAYTKFIGDQTAPFSRARSTEIIKSSLRSMFKTTFDIDNEDTISSIILNPVNTLFISDLIRLAKVKYADLPEVEDIVYDVKDWQVPNLISVYEPYKLKGHFNRSILTPFYTKVDKNGRDKLSQPEQKFINVLESCDSELQWWYKNGERERKFFGIAYKSESGRQYAFYPDFIIRTKSSLLIVEIKDDSDFKNENLLKLNAGQEYIANYRGKENLYFYILSPIDFEYFKRSVEGRGFDNYASKYEENLQKIIASRKRIASEEEEPNKDDQELLEEYDKELTKAVKDRELLEMSLEQAQTTISNMKEALALNPASASGGSRINDIKLPVPFHICILGEVSDENNLLSDMRQYLAKFQLDANDWTLTIFNNSKLKTKDVFALLKRGQSKYHVAVTGQIHHHSAKGNQRANALSELRDEKYIDYIVGSSPKDVLTSTAFLESLNNYIRSKFSK